MTPVKRIVVRRKSQRALWLAALARQLLPIVMNHPDKASAPEIHREFGSGLLGNPTEEVIRGALEWAAEAGLMKRLSRKDPKRPNATIKLYSLDSNGAFALAFDPLFSLEVIDG